MYLNWQDAMPQIGRPRVRSGIGSYLRGDAIGPTPEGGFLDQQPPKGAAGVAWWKQVLGYGGDALNLFMPQIKKWLGITDPESGNALMNYLRDNLGATSAQLEEMRKAQQAQMWVMIGIAGAAVLGGLYLFSKKGKSVTPVVPVKV